MGKIEIDVEAVERAAKNLSGYADQLEEQSKSAKGVITKVEAAWISSYTDEYNDCIELTAKQILKAAQNLRQISSSLYKLAGNVREAERKLQAIISSGDGSGGGFSAGGGGGGGGNSMGGR